MVNSDTASAALLTVDEMATVSENEFKSLLH
jgi:hypothetical protein